MSYNESLRTDSNYPPMSQSEWDNAPWNEVEPPEVEINVAVSQSLSKDTTVVTSDYNVDDEGHRDIMETNVNGAYRDSKYTPLDLINEFKKYLENALKSTNIEVSTKRRYKNLLKECEGWIEDEFNVEEI